MKLKKNLKLSMTNNKSSNYDKNQGVVVSPFGLRKIGKNRKGSKISLQKKMEKFPQKYLKKIKSINNSPKRRRRNSNDHYTDQWQSNSYTFKDTASFNHKNKRATHLISSSSKRNHQ